MKQVMLKGGKAIVDEVPAPQVDPGMVLVRVIASCISIGTEMSGLRSSGMPLWKRALKQPQNLKKALRMVASQGVSATRSFVESKTGAQPTGYSAAGTVLEVGEGVEDLVAGEPVACAGAQCAHHAEVIRVPRNLVAPLPEGLDPREASTVTLGAIALQGVRRAQPTLGETFVVIGLGVVGQLTAQLLRANGVRVIGTDLDRRRIRLALDLGMDLGVHPDDGDDLEEVARLTDGLGADGVIITAATPSDAVVATAFNMCRKKGRVVLVGDVGLHLERRDFYYKELDFLISSSYGPGRYDRNYEEGGLDYPAAYVRWTENRNMAEFLRLLVERKVRVGPLIAGDYPIEKASDAYAALSGGGTFPPMLLLSYPRPEGDPAPRRVVVNPAAPPAPPGRIRVALVGAGGFAKTYHLPNIKALSDRLSLVAVASRAGHNAAETARRFGARYSTTDSRRVLDDPEVDAVVIATRHDLHASLALAALEKGKHVLVEKPLALDAESLRAIEAFYAERGAAPAPLLITGFNRRFSPHARKVREVVAARSNPMIIAYRMNAGRIPFDHWIHSPEGGGRNIGEACHVYDLFTFLTGSRAATVEARAVTPASAHYSRRDNFVATIGFEDGSVASLVYTALGSSDHPKEQMEVFVDGKVLVLDNYQRLTIRGSRAKGLKTGIQEKGHRQELEEFAAAVKKGGEWPSPLWQQVQAMEIAFRVEEALGAPAPAAEAEEGQG